MNRLALSALWRTIKNPIHQISARLPPLYESSKKLFTSFSRLSYYSSPSGTCIHNCTNSLQSPTFLSRLNLLPLNGCGQAVPSRSLTKFSLRKGKRKTVHAVLKRFYRLDWGIWIRGKCGRQKKLYKKSGNRIRRLRQHVFCNGKQSYLLDTMVTSYWRKPKYYIDDPYEPYHRREEFHLTRKKPYIPVES